jgi:tRNA U38,U39,U40 pseudouridine synthase TruA
MPKKPFYPRTLLNDFHRYKLGVQYVGSGFSGWAISDCATLPSVEDALQNALLKFAGEGNHMNFKGSSRTDAGVHALRNVFQVDLNKTLRRRKDESPHNPICLPPLQKATSNFDRANYSQSIVNGIGVERAEDKAYQIDKLGVDPNERQSDDTVKSLNNDDEVMVNDAPIRAHSTSKIRGALNHFLGRAKHSVLITDVSLEDESFDARGSAVGRTYMYRILQPNR